MSRPTTSPRLRLWREILPFLGMALLPSALLGIVSGALEWPWGVTLVWGVVVGISYPLQRFVRGLAVDGVVLRWAMVLGIAHFLVALIIALLVRLVRP